MQPGCVKAGRGWELQNAFNVLCVVAAVSEGSLMLPPPLTGVILVLFLKQISELNVYICHGPWSVWGVGTHRNRCFICCDIMGQMLTLRECEELNSGSCGVTRSPGLSY